MLTSRPPPHPLYRIADACFAAGDASARLPLALARKDQALAAFRAQRIATIEAAGRLGSDEERPFR